MDDFFDFAQRDAYIQSQSAQAPAMASVGSAVESAAMTAGSAVTSPRAVELLTDISLTMHAMNDNMRRLYDLTQAQQQQKP
jgi:hypothetical protein